MTTVARVGDATKRVATPHIFAALAIVSFIIAVVQLPNYGAALVPAVLSVALVGATAALVSSGGDFRSALARGRFGTWTSLWVAVAFGVASLSWRTPQVGTASQIDLRSVTLALFLVAFAWATWLIGYMLPMGRQCGEALTPFVLGRMPRTVTDGRVLLLFMLGLTGQLLKIRTNSFGYLADPVAQITAPSIFGQAIVIVTSFGSMSVAAAAYLAFRSNTRRRLAIAIAMCLTECAVGLASGDKQPVLIALLAFALGYAAARRRLPWPWLAAGLALFVIVVIPFNQAYRDAVRGGQTAPTLQQSIVATPSILRGTVAGTDQENIQNSSTSLSLRLREIDSVAIVVQRTPSQIPYMSPVALLGAPILGIVPRAFWPSKPVLDGGYKFSQEYFGLPPEIHSSTAVTPVADLFRRGGLAVVFLGMLILGVVFRLIDSMLDKVQDVRYAFFVVTLFPLLVKLEADAVALLASIIPILLAAALAGRLLKAATPEDEPRGSW